MDRVGASLLAMTSSPLGSALNQNPMDRVVAELLAMRNSTATPAALCHCGPVLSTGEAIHAGSGTATVRDISEWRRSGSVLNGSRRRFAPRDDK